MDFFTGKRWALFSLILIFSILLQPVYSGQTGQLHGRISSIETGDPVPNASIQVEGTQLGVFSDNEGRFGINLTPGEYKLIISALGFSAREIIVSVPESGSEYIEIELFPEHFEIEGVDVYGFMAHDIRDSSITRESLSLLPAVTRIGAIEIEKQGAVTLTDAIKFVPGGWTETRGRKTKQFFSVRGQKYPYPDYSINGIWQKEFEETVYFMSALDIESIEIVRSSSALVKGLSGLTGVVDIKTRRPERETVSLLAKYGELNNYVTNFQYGNRIEDVSFTTSAALFGTDGPPGRKGEERILNLSGSGDWRVNNKVHLFGGVTYIGGSRQFVTIEEPGAPNIAGRQEKFDPIRTLLSYVKLNYTGEDGSITEVQTNLSYRDIDYTNHNVVQETTTMHTELDYEYGMNLLHSRELSASNTLRAGVLYNHWVAPEGKRYYAGRACDVHTWSGVIASEQMLGRFLLDGGIRLIGGYIVEFGGFGIEGSGAGFRNVQPVTDQYAPFEWQSVLGASYIISPLVSLHYNFSGGTISPRRGSLDEKGVRPGNETRLQHDLGLRYRYGAFSEISVSAFYAGRQDALELSGQTVLTEVDYLIELYENIDKRSYGVELTTRLQVPSLHSLLFANATFINGENETDGRWMKDDKLPNLILNLGIQFDHSGFDANLYVNHTGPYINNRFVDRMWIEQYSDFPLGDFVAVDITAGYTFDRKFSTRVFAEVKNLFDQKYLTVAGYPDLGRLFFLGIKILFE